MTVYSDRNTALLVRAVLFLAAATTCSISSMVHAQAPIIDSTQSRSSSYGQPAQPSSYDASYQLQQLQQEVMQLRGMVEEQAFLIQQLQQRQQQLEQGRAAGQSGSAAVDNSAPLKQSESAPIPSASSEEAPAPQAVASADVSGDEDAYRAAYNLIKAQKFDQAIEAFQKFVQNYSGSRFEPNAYYWLGELYLQVQDLDASRQSYGVLVERYPDNSKIADARYKLAKVHFLKGEKSKSRELLNTVIASYPGTATAQAAQKFLKENF